MPQVKNKLLLAFFSNVRNVNSKNSLDLLYKPRVLSIAINLYEATASLDLALLVAKQFERTQEINRMASAFEHRDLIQITRF